MTVSVYYLDIKSRRVKLNYNSREKEMPLQLPDNNIKMWQKSRNLETIEVQQEHRETENIDCQSHSDSGFESNLLTFYYIAVQCIVFFSNGNRPACMQKVKFNVLNK